MQRNQIDTVSMSVPTCTCLRISQVYDKYGKGLRLLSNEGSASTVLRQMGFTLNTAVREAMGRISLWKVQMGGTFVIFTGDK